jgi:hypothetical protein
MQVEFTREAGREYFGEVTSRINVPGKSEIKPTERALPLRKLKQASKAMGADAVNEFVVALKGVARNNAHDRSAGASRLSLFNRGTHRLLMMRSVN